MWPLQTDWEQNLKLVKCLQSDTRAGALEFQAELRLPDPIAVAKGGPGLEQVPGTEAGVDGIKPKTRLRFLAIHKQATLSPTLAPHLPQSPCLAPPLALTT